MTSSFSDLDFTSQQIRSFRIRNEQSLNHVNISQFRVGHQPEPQHRRYQDSN